MRVQPRLVSGHDEPDTCRLLKRMAAAEKKSAALREGLVASVRGDERTSGVDLDGQ